MDERPDWGGVFAYLPTLFTAEEALDVPALHGLVDELVGAGIHGVTPLGSTGEFPYVAPADRVRLAGAVVEAAAGRVPVVHGVGGFALAEVLEQVRGARAAGVDGLLCVQQAFYSPSADEIVDFHAAVAEESGLPVVAYHNPGQCRVPFDEAVIARLSAIPNVVGFKDASGDLRNIVRWRRAAEAEIDLFAATAVPLVPAMLYGAVGWMSGPACAVPRASVALYELCRAGAWQQAVELEQVLAPLNAAFVRLGQAQTIKSLLAHLGHGSGRLAAPLRPVTADDASQLAHVHAEVTAAAADFTNRPGDAS